MAPTSAHTDIAEGACGTASASRSRKGRGEGQPLHPDIANLLYQGRRDADTNIEEWVGSDEVTVEDLRYVAGYLRTRDRDAISNDWRASMAALFVAMPTLAVTIFTGFAPEKVVAQLLPYTIVVLVSSGVGVLWCLIFMLIHTVHSARSTRLLAKVEHRLELESRVPPKKRFPRLRWSSPPAVRS
ncbi:hypothetical protein ACFY9N_03995 [Microbacterium sp. NPDC008134]|uniref:hypothetical protein n=1 Tax=Microbacterium sp. NPDC008134 TaxID=3364183 RepID=UPI0036E0AE89